MEEFHCKFKKSLTLIEANLVEPVPFLITLFCVSFVYFLQVVSISTLGTQRKQRQTLTENSNFNARITVVFRDVEFSKDVTETDDPFKVNFNIEVHDFKLKFAENVGLKLIGNLGKNNEQPKRQHHSVFTFLKWRQLFNW